MIEVFVSRDRDGRDDDIQHYEISSMLQNENLLLTYYPVTH